MKVRSYRFLFRIFSFLSDKTNGFPLFAKYKLLLGTLILTGVAATSCTKNKTSMKVACYDYEPAISEDTIEPVEPPDEPIMCYEPAVPYEIPDTVKAVRVKHPVISEDPIVACYEISEPTCYITVYDPLPEQEAIQVYTHAETMPQFPGGDKAMLKFIQDNLQYPPVTTCYESSGSGRVIIRIIINSEGEVTHPEIVRSLDPSCDKEAIRVIKMMPRWTPGKQDGKNVDVYYMLPVRFQLQ